MVIRSALSDVEISDEPLTEFGLRGAGERGARAALLDAPSGRTVTYAELVESVRAVTAGLAERGFGKGEVFARYAPNLLDCAVAFHAVATAGGVNTTANPLLTADQLAHQLSDCRARLLVTVPSGSRPRRSRPSRRCEIPTAIIVPSAPLTPKEVTR
jgi:acyl-coenzyme A synthetase/AMP-(fatty) acid ligase